MRLMVDWLGRLIGNNLAFGLLMEQALGQQSAFGEGLLPNDSGP